MLLETPINAPCYIIVGGMKEGEGIVITRDRDGVNRTDELGGEKWFVAQTNTDYWLEHDERYEKTVEAMEIVGRENIDSQNIVDQVLHADGVLQFITIFSASLSAIANLDNITLIPSISTQKK
jgi:hypothetical protein